ncbi:MAG: hypothetical protein M1450_02620 [Patescibacteria group bacterium]|nr:hypothetical protein [Patescibacteria group bacterium]
MKLFVQSILLIASFVLVFVWQKSFLADYTIPLIGFFIFLYIIVFGRKKMSKNGFNFQGGSLSIFLLNTVILLFIFSTGGISSSLFFLLYFLSFGIAFVFEPLTIFIFVLGTFAVFLPEAVKNDVFGNFLRIGSLVLLSPLAYFFAREFKEREKDDDKTQKLKERTKDAANTISEDVGEVLKSNEKNLKEKDVEKLNEILEETEDLRLESKE